jgi:hypothetical protein
MVRLSKLSIIVVLATAMVAIGANPATANTDTTTGAPYTCTTNPNAGNQNVTVSVTATDTVDPAQAGQSETYRFSIPFNEAKTPVSANYRGGTTSIHIPSTFSVSSVSMQDPSGGSQIHSTAAIQNGNIVITSTADVPIDGTNYPTPDLIVNGKVQASAAGVGVNWLVPFQIVANAFVQGFGTIVATCTPNQPSTVMAKTAVPPGPQAPVPVNQSVALREGTSKAVTLTATDTDTPQNELTFSIASQPAHGTLSGTPPTVTYTPQSLFVGTDSFTFKVADPQGNSGIGTISLNVFSSGAADTTPPTINVASPTQGAVYLPGQGVKASFSCSDTTTGIKSCAGTVANGAAISTSVGAHTFVVNAFDNANNPAQTTVSYRIVATAPVKSAVASIPIDCGSTALTAPTSLPVAVYAPAQVGTGRDMTFRVAFGTQSVPALTTATNLKYIFNTPANGTVKSASIESGTGTSNARVGANVTVSSGVVTLTLPGPIAGGVTSSTSFTPPVFDVTITAGATVGTKVQTKFQKFQEHLAVQLLTQDLNCPGGNAGNNQPNPTLTSTTIIDTTPPIALIAKPANGDVYLVGDTVDSNYACVDDHSISSCTGTVVNGTAVDTMTAGIKTFTLTAKDAAGNIAKVFVSYTVDPATVTFTTRFPDSEGAALDATAAYFHTTRANLPRAAVAAVAYADSLNPDLALPVQPLANTGSIAITTTYSHDQVPYILDLAAKWGMSGDDFHKFATEVLVYVWSVQTQ